MQLQYFAQTREQLQHFLGAGGPILWVLLALMFLFWLLVFERCWFVVFSFPRLKKNLVSSWLSRDDRNSWFARKQREASLAQAQHALMRNIGLLKLITVVFPMLGLLGTVSGMMQIFDTMQEQGNTNTQAMAEGISLATLPTMAGMVSALVALFVVAQLAFILSRKHLHLERLLALK
ncbi:MotA/TolQ/ExbB proton channel family protein [Alginatibacterium sediminis]|uniref:MotA/TolQ/ExbB proton channel family protein n=1 Tax=Alginatibacterium sediminis TaxID=2164068 RepID=A0A420EH68_9ALTE|nr:MotA/TolQ/ExbB proton channel family protein [Alginatibacterium sediminis]RKF20010.1 MotA/TolQ/ExbB proton channel family protein [Alginatibacterium sediminis]